MKVSNDVAPSAKGTGTPAHVPSTAACSEPRSRLTNSSSTCSNFHRLSTPRLVRRPCRTFPIFKQTQDVKLSPFAMSKDSFQRDPLSNGQKRGKRRIAVGACVLVSVLLAGYGRFPGAIPDAWPPMGDNSAPSCHPPLPNLLAYNPPKADDSILSELLLRVDEHLEKLAAGNDTDSISVSIVTSNGPLYEKGFGVARANETEPLRRSPPNRNSIYRIASVSKLFTVLETLILRQRGVLHWYA